MKTPKFIIVLVTLVLLFAITVFAATKVVAPPQSSYKVTTLDGKASVYQLDMNNTHYVVVISSTGDVAITR